MVNESGRSPSGRAGRASTEPQSSVRLGHSATIPNAALLATIRGEAVAGYGRKCRVCGGTSSLEQLNRYWHYEGAEVCWLPGRYCSRLCMAQSPVIDWKRAAIAMEAAKAGETACGLDPKDDSAGLEEASHKTSRRSDTSEEEK